MKVEHNNFNVFTVGAIIFVIGLFIDGLTLKMVTDMWGTLPLVTAVFFGMMGTTSLLFGLGLVIVGGAIIGDVVEQQVDTFFRE